MPAQKSSFKEDVLSEVISRDQSLVRGRPYSVSTLLQQARETWGYHKGEAEKTAIRYNLRGKKLEPEKFICHGLVAQVRDKAEWWRQRVKLLEEFRRNGIETVKLVTKQGKSGLVMVLEPVNA